MIVVAVTSEQSGTSAEDLPRTADSTPSTLGYLGMPGAEPWECARYVNIPKELIIWFDFRCEIAHLVLSAKEDRLIPEIVVLIEYGPGVT